MSQIKELTTEDTEIPEKNKRLKDENA